MVSGTNVFFHIYLFLKYPKLRKNPFFPLNFFVYRNLMVSGTLYILSLLFYYFAVLKPHLQFKTGRSQFYKNLMVSGTLLHILHILHMTFIYLRHMRNKQLLRCFFHRLIKIWNCHLLNTFTLWQIKWQYSDQIYILMCQ